VAYIPLEKLMGDQHCRYSLVLAAAKRATELAQGSLPLVETKSKKITTIALEEVAAGKVRFIAYDRQPGNKKKLTK